MAAKLVIVLTFLLVVCALVIGAPSDVVKDSNDGNMTKGGKSPQLADTKPQLTPLEQGMQPIFFITKYFLNNILQPEEKGPPDILIQSVVRLADSDMTTKEILSQLENNWQQISKYYLGFAICIIIGLLFIIIMPIVGFCFCCCRICGNCGGTAGQMDPKFSRCKHVSYTVFLLLIATIMLAGVVCAFVTNDMFHTQVTDKDRGYISNVNRSITGLEKYMEGTVQELKTDVVKKVDNGVGQVSGMVNRTGSVVIDQVKVITGADTMLEKLVALADDLPTLKVELETLSDNIATATTDANQLNSSLGSVRDEIKKGLQNCQMQNCQDASNKADELKVNVELNKIPSLNPIINAIDKYLNIKQKIKDAESNFDKMGTEMTKKIQLEIDNAVKELNTAKTTIHAEMVKLERQIANISSEVGKNADNYLNMASTDGIYNNMAVFVGVGLSCLFLLIVMLMYMGMTFGVCGERPYDDARFCNKGVGANFLMASVGFMFMTSAVLMLLTLILFMIGAPFQTEICRHLMQPLKSPFIERIDTHINLGQWLYGASSSEKLTVKEVLTNCENNTALYVAFKLNRTYNVGSSIDEIISKLEPEITKLVDDVKGQAYQDMVVVPDDLKNQLAQMKAEQRFSGDDFSNAIAEVEKEITMDLSSYITNLEMLGIDSSQINNAINTLRGLNDNELPKLRQQLDNIKLALMSVKRVNSISQTITDIELNIKEIETKLGPAEQTTTMGEAATQTGERIMDASKSLASDLTDLVENEVGRCRPMYDSYFLLVSSTCEDVLNPFNSFWCAYGLCLLLFIPAIIFAVKLAGLYRKTDKYLGKPFETIGGSNVYPGDHIPLDDVRKPPPYRDGRSHGPSGGYDNSSAPPLEYGQGMLDFEMPYAVPARKGLYPQHRDNRPLLDQPM